MVCCSAGVASHAELTCAWFVAEDRVFEALSVSVLAALSLADGEAVAAVAFGLSLFIFSKLNLPVNRLE